MNACIRGCAFLACLLPLVAWANPPAFEQAQAKEIEKIIQRAVEKALSDSAVQDAASSPVAAKIDAADAPALSEAQRQALSKMIDDAVRRALTAPGPAPAAVPETVALSPRAQKHCFEGDFPYPVTDLRRQTLEARAARAQGFDEVAAECALRTGSGSAGTALTLTDTGLNSVPSTPKTSNIQVIANGSGARVSLKMDQSSATGDGQGKAVYWSRSAVFSAPLDKEDEVGTGLVDLDGLTNGFEVTYNATRIQTAPLGRTGKDGMSLLFSMPRDCKALGIGMDACDLSTLLRVADTRSGDTGQVGADARRIADEYSVPGRAWLQGFRLKVGHDDYAYYDPQRLTKHTEGEITWGTGVFAGFLSGNAYYTAGVDYQRAYKAARSGVACPMPEEGASIVQCVNGALGAPSVSERHLLSLEGRWRLGERAVGVRAIHDFKNGDSGVDVPIYLFPDKDGLLTGGLRLGWTDTEQFYAAIFVGFPFTLMD